MSERYLGNGLKNMYRVLCEEINELAIDIESSQQKIREIKFLPNLESTSAEDIKMIIDLEDKIRERKMEIGVLKNIQVEIFGVINQF